MREAGALAREPVEIRRLHPRMAAQAANPIVLIVNGDEQDVRAFGFGGVKLFTESGEDDPSQHGGQTPALFFRRRIQFQMNSLIKFSRYS